MSRHLSDGLSSIDTEVEACNVHKLMRWMLSMLREIPYHDI